jgi:hypothetical protein
LNFSSFHNVHSPRRDHDDPVNQMRWRKSSLSGYTECVELTRSLRVVRDSKNPSGPVLTADVARLLAAIRRGDLNR